MQQPADWSIELIQGYFVWCKAVVEQLRGANQELEAALDAIFHGSFVFKGKEGPVLCKCILMETPRHFCLDTIPPWNLPRRRMFK